MQIALVTPALPNSRQGNRITAERWLTILRELSHEVTILREYASEPADMLVALHAVKSADSVAGFRAQSPGRPILVAVTGTDIYGEAGINPVAEKSLNFADRIIALQPATAGDLTRWQPKVRVILQSAVPASPRLQALDNVFEVGVCGHLRSVKDPLRTAIAVRSLPASSRIQITHIGKALTPEMDQAARSEMQVNPRYHWLGELSHSESLALLSRWRLLVVSSHSEGGPAVIAEAIVSGVPVLATRVSGCVGMLGPDYPGYFAPGDTAALTALLLRFEGDPEFRDGLQKEITARQSFFTRAQEIASWRSLLDELRVGYPWKISR